MKNCILQNLTNYKQLESTEILELDSQKYINSSFKLNLLKDKEKGAKVSNSKFYLSCNDFVIKFQHDETCEKITLFPSKDIQNFDNVIDALKTLDVKKIEVYTNGSFETLQKELLKNNYSIELTRKDKFFNNGIYENEVVLSHIKEDR